MAMMAVELALSSVAPLPSEFCARLWSRSERNQGYDREDASARASERREDLSSFGTTFEDTICSGGLFFLQDGSQAFCADSAGDTLGVVSLGAPVAGTPSLIDGSKCYVLLNMEADAGHTLVQTAAFPWHAAAVFISTGWQRQAMWC